jgi:hypothetical protein
MVKVRVIEDYRSGSNTIVEKDEEYYVDGYIYSGANSYETYAILVKPNSPDFKKCPLSYLEVIEINSPTIKNVFLNNSKEPIVKIYNSKNDVISKFTTDPNEGQVIYYEDMGLRNW